MVTLMRPFWRRPIKVLALVLLLGCLGIIGYGLSTGPRSGTGLRLPQNLNDANARWKLASAAGAKGGMADFVDTFLYGKIDTSDAVLRRESLDRSIRRLISDDQQYFGFITGADFRESNLEEMLTSRRVVKVLLSIKRLPPAQREAKCQQMFAQVFRVHTNTFRVILQHEKNPSSPRNTQSMLATQLSLCAAMFATADSGRRDLLADEFAQLDRLRVDLELRLFSHQPPCSAGIVGVILRYAVPDTRFLASALRLAASADPASTNLLQLLDDQCRGRGMKLDTITIFDWDAQTGGAGPRRPSLVVSNATTITTLYSCFAAQRGGHLVPLDEQRQFLQTLRSLVLPRADAKPAVVIPRLPLMRTLAEDESTAARCAAALALGRLPDRRDLRVLCALLAALDDKDPAVARCAAVALNGEQGAGGGGIAFSSSTRDAIVELGADAVAAIPALVRLIRQEPASPVFSMRSWAVWILKAIGDNGSANAKSAMADLINDPDLARDPNFINAVNFY